MIKLFDAHCHLQDPRILHVAPKRIEEALETGVVHFSVNGVSEKDWHLVKEMSEAHPSIIPNFGLHPWFITQRSPNWFETLKHLLTTTPSSAVGEIGLDKGSMGKKIDFADQVQVFSQQLQLAKEMKKPASIHCVRAYGDLLEILKSAGPFPHGLILHSYLGSAEMVRAFAEIGAYFSFSGFLMSMKESKAKRMLKSVPNDRILLETDAPDARPQRDQDSLFSIGNHQNAPGERRNDDGDDDYDERPTTSRSFDENLNHPGNIRHILSYVACLLEMEERELAEISYRNAVNLFSYKGSKLVLER